MATFIDDLTAADALDGTELLHGYQGGRHSRKLTVQQILDLLSAGMDFADGTLTMGNALVVTVDSIADGSLDADFASLGVEGSFNCDGSAITTDGSGTLTADGDVNCNTLNAAGGFTSDGGAINTDGGGGLMAASLMAGGFGFDGLFQVMNAGGQGVFTIDVSNGGILIDTAILPTSDPAALGNLWCDPAADHVVKVSQG